MNAAGDVVLGVSAGLHDAAAALLVDGELVAAAEEERFTRRKHESRLPRHAMAWCLEDAGISARELRAVAFYEKPLTAYERIITMHGRAGPRGAKHLADAAIQWTGRKLWVRYRLERILASLGDRRPRVVFAEHHQSHAASAFYPSPFASAAILTCDGVGEWTTASIGMGNEDGIQLLAELRFPDSVGLLYTAVTTWCGFAANDGEYKLMGLAPYGRPRFADVMREHLVRIDDDGSLRLNQRWFDYQSGRRMLRARAATILEGPARPDGAPIGSREADLAASVQAVTEEAVLKMAGHAHALTGASDLCMAGGVALNCVANERLVAEGPFDALWVQPAAGDAGGAIGAAYWAWHDLDNQPVRQSAGVDGMRGSFLGPRYPAAEVGAWLRDEGVDHQTFDTPAELHRCVAQLLATGSIVGWFVGRMEFGPRALGHRSILADPRDGAVVARLNEAVKGREDFRPFAPSVLRERVAEWFVADEDLPYMVRTAAVRGGASPDGHTAGSCDLGARLAAVVSPIPACTHVDGSARVQTVDADRNPTFHALLTAFEAETGCPVLLNTSFNGPSEPIVRTPGDALRCAASRGVDVCVIEGHMVRLRPDGDAQA